MPPAIPELTILEYPDRRLRTKAQPIAPADTNDELRAIAQGMLKAMYASKGIGLAATQVNIHRHLIVLDVSETRDQPMILINCEIEVIDPELVSHVEGCLSVPGFYDDVMRPKCVKVSYLNEMGEAQSIEADGLLGVCIQHERDHLNGKLFVDYLSSLKRQRITKKLEKQQKLASNS